MDIDRNTDDSTRLEEGRNRPKRDVSSGSAIGECEHCGGNAHSMFGGEHIWKCSEIVPKESVEELLDTFEEEHAKFSEAAAEAEDGAKAKYNAGMAEACRSGAVHLRRMVQGPQTDG